MSIGNETFTIGTILGKTVPYLIQKGLPNAKLEADLMLAAVLGLPRVKLYSKWDCPLETDEVNRYREMLVKRLNGTPLAYLSGKKSFLSWDFAVSPAVLIPRPDTELLVEALVDRLPANQQLRGIDVGTGSGIIAISLAKLLPQSNWTALDISDEALRIAADNAKALGVAKRVTFKNSDLLASLLSDNDMEMNEADKYDVIVSNPPYIPSADIAGLQAEVHCEPILALDGGQDGLDLYRRLLIEVPKLLKTNGFLAVEHGFDQRVALTKIFEDNDFSVEALQDLAGLDRVIVGRKK